MTQPEAIETIKAVCDEMSRASMRLNPAIRSVADAELQAALLKATYQLTIDLEVVKKLVRKKAGESQPLT